MQLHYLGTAAAEGLPAIFCTCAVCERARRAGGRNIRTRPQALIDGKILLDFGPDSYLHALRYGLDLSTIRTCLITHVHEDHLTPTELYFRAPWLCHLKTESTLTVYGSEEVGEFLSARPDGRLDDSDRVIFRAVEPYATFTAEGYRITPLPAVHGTRQPLVYVISHEGKTLLYAHDTSNFRGETWDWLAQSGLHFDLLSLDCTEGTRKIDYEGHMNIERDIAMRRRMLLLGLIDEKTRVVANHFSHNGGMTYDDLQDPAVNGGLTIAYDGMTVEI